MSATDRGELGVTGSTGLPTVTLLLADVESSTRLWETQPEEMRAARGLTSRMQLAQEAAHRAQDAL
jgi:class 3 adenylate cyclase